MKDVACQHQDRHSDGQKPRRDSVDPGPMLVGRMDVTPSCSFKKPSLSLSRVGATSALCPSEHWEETHG